MLDGPVNVSDSLHATAGPDSITLSASWGNISAAPQILSAVFQPQRLLLAVHGATKCFDCATHGLQISAFCSCCCYCCCAHQFVTEEAEEACVCVRMNKDVSECQKGQSWISLTECFYFPSVCVMHS